MDPEFLYAADADRDGSGRRSLARRCRAGELVRVRAGVYVEASQWEKMPQWDRDRAVITAAVDQGQAPRILIQQSAAVIWGLPVIGRTSEVLLLAPGSSHGRRRGNLCWTPRTLLEPATTRHGLTLTSRAQTVLDMAARLPFERAVPAMDHVLRPDAARSLPALEKDGLLILSGKLPDEAKRTRARRVISFADGRSESPGESYSRAVLYLHGFPKPELQYEFRSTGGQFLGRTDFFWKDYALVGEFDGAVKYGPVTAGRSPGATRQVGTASRETLILEKRREDAIRATGVGFVRWSWSDIHKAKSDPDGLVRMLLTAGLPKQGRRG
ncbi:type IV toxin-antitoxin system AbiEi family antitoxin domain-containing protein [Arthrobacter gengyunqii]|uniref:Type IV toxin-antitoxin system AbiEi family antitoxin domain-containing protein n=1 Tax=Arthrobacter gengyunqii TaxID=2886940 RepID=A0A9X1M1S6_9MICC|nr:type IV toxin-antitoxin system AbiEi family antitoxin domain-containing protein [Arthrobacter gengyunqii]MCC3269733.1 type IV toxin-antitoxin system AbiEi family antitoxin domain-containing protein [Arthrobacter gengyunqii]UOY97189.1 type IV toxin-antitoxin system AbiEi family antitoxin domain-containing protein [Arthrobacter gengyunqii]